MEWTAKIPALVKYLGVYMNTKLTQGAHIKRKVYARHKLVSFI